MPAPCRVTRHALYERNCFGNHENIRTEVVMVAEAMGQADKYKGFAERCMEEYKLDGWTVPDLLDPDDISIVMKKWNRGDCSVRARSRRREPETRAGTGGASREPDPPGEPGARWRPAPAFH